MVQRSSNPPGPIAEGGGVHRQSGKLARSWEIAISGSSIADLKGAAFTRAGRAKILELGGRVDAPDGTGPTSGWIWIPTDINRGADGRALQAPGDLLFGAAFFANRHLKRFASEPPAIIDGRPSPAWNLIVSPWVEPMFIGAKFATYKPQLGFYDTGNEFSKVLLGKLADAGVKAWQEADKE